MFASAEPVSSRSSGVRLEDLVAVPIDVGKHTAMAKVIDFTGAELAKPFEFPLDRGGVRSLVARVGQVVPGSVSLVRVGLEAAGHYHLPLAGGVLPVEWELRVLNPGHVSMQRKVNGQRGVKTDKIDLAAIARSVAGRPRGDRPAVRRSGDDRDRLGRAPAPSVVAAAPDDPAADHPCRPVLPRARHRPCGRLCCPRPAGWSSPSSPTRPGSPGSVHRRLRTFAANRGVRMTTPLAERIVEAARQALPVPGAEVVPATPGRRPAAARRHRRPDRTRPTSRSRPCCPRPPSGCSLHTGLGTGPSRPLRRRRRRSRTLARTPPALPRRRAHATPLRISRPPRDGHITREGSVLLRVALVDLGMGLWHQRADQPRATAPSSVPEASPAGSSSPPWPTGPTRSPSPWSATNNPGSPAAGPHDRRPMHQQQPPLAHSDGHHLAAGDQAVPSKVQSGRLYQKVSS